MLFNKPLHNHRQLVGQWLCGSVGRVVASYTRGLWFRSSYRQRRKENETWDDFHDREVMSVNPVTGYLIYWLNIHIYFFKKLCCLKRPKIDEKEAEDGPYLWKPKLELKKSEKCI